MTYVSILCTRGYFNLESKIHCNTYSTKEQIKSSKREKTGVFWYAQIHKKKNKGVYFTVFLVSHLTHCLKKMMENLTLSVADFRSNIKVRVIIGQTAIIKSLRAASPAFPLSKATVLLWWVKH